MKAVIKIDPLPREFLALLLGCAVMTPKGRGKLIRVGLTEHGCAVVFGNKESIFTPIDIKPILLPMAEMDEHTEKASHVVYDEHKEHHNRAIVHAGLWCLRNGYDSMGWLTSGQAIREIES